MGLQECGLNLDNSGKELQPHGSFEFPCAGYYADLQDRQEDIVPWHYHEEIEVIYIKTGSITLQLPTKSFDLKRGDCIVINSNIPHYLSTDSHCETYCMVFKPLLITSTDDSTFAKKYIAPLLACPSFDGYVLNMSDYPKQITNFISAFEALAMDIPGFEFLVRESLSTLCFLVYQNFEQELALENTTPNLDTIRIRFMLDYIHNHFSEDLTVNDIAKAADIGERECLRCFTRTIKQSPIQYVLHYRIMKGAEYLLNDPSTTISEISNLCGFDSASNFSKHFKRIYKSTPKDYRKAHTI